MSFFKKYSLSVYFIVASPIGISPSQRFRFEHYLNLLEQNHIHYKVSPYFSVKGRSTLYKKSNTFRKVAVVTLGLFKRIIDLFKVLPYKYVYIHREAAPVGPPFFEWIVSKLLRKRIVYDFDDSIWVPAMSEYNKNFLSVRHFSKVGNICRWAFRVTVGNSFLKSFADKYSSNVYLIPTVVNTETVHNKVQKQESASPAVGWTGSFSTLMYLDIIVPVLRKLQEEIDFTFYVIADKDPGLALKNYKFIPWNKETEAEDLLNFHIGVMPLTDDEITRGKCGFKAIQYMALGMPALVSPVGVNVEIVSHSNDGFICNNLTEWEENLRLLLNDAALRRRMGLAARKKIEDKYSVKATSPSFLENFIKH